MQDVAERAGVTKRTLYVKVGDKEAMFAAVVSTMLKDWRHVVDDTGAAHSLQHRFEYLGRHLLSVMLEPDMLRLNRVMLAEAYRFPSMVSLLMAQIEQGPIPQLARLLAEVRGATGDPENGDQVAARLFYDMIVGAPMRVALTGRPPSLTITHDEWVRHAVTLFLQGWQSISAVSE